MAVRRLALVHGISVWLNKWAEACAVFVAGGLAVFVVTEIAKLLKLDARQDIAPLLAIASVAVAAVLYYKKESSDKLRRTLDVYEKQVYDRDLRVAFSTVDAALREGTYETDATPARVGSHRDHTSHLLNYLEVSCTGVTEGLYDVRLFRTIMEPLAEMLIGNFLQRPVAGELPSLKFLAAMEAEPVANSDDTEANFAKIRATFPDLFEKASRSQSKYISGESTRGGA